MTTTIVQLEQGSEAWIEWRKTKRTASETPVVMGLSPYQKPPALARVKRGLATVFQNSAMSRGIQYEPEARAWFESHMGMIGKPVVAELGDYAASLDWWDEKDTVCELKVPANAESKLWTGEAPEMYIAQLQHQMQVVDAQIGYLCVYLPEASKGITYEVERDPRYWTQIHEAWEIFWAKYMTGDLPDDERTDQDWLDAVERYLAHKSAVEAATALLEAAKGELIELAPDGGKGFGIQVIKAERKGNIDYKKVPELKGVDLEQYRGKATSYYTVKESA